MNYEESCALAVPTAGRHSWSCCRTRAACVWQGYGQHDWNTFDQGCSDAESIAYVATVDGTAVATQATRVAFGKMWARPAAVPGVMSPHYLDSSLHQPSASWPEVGRRVLLPRS